jgi:hypothetical protein
MYRKIFKLVGQNFLDTSGEPLIRRIMRSGDVSKNFQVGRTKFSRHVWRASYSSNYEVRRSVEKLSSWSDKIFSTRLESHLFVELWGPETCRKIIKLVGQNILDTSGEPLIRRIKRSGEVSKNFQVGRTKFSRHVWRASNLSIYEVRRRVEKISSWSNKIFSTRLKSI